MDKQRAKFILQSFRPDGEDVHEEAFAEALSLAAEDRQLGEWLARERAQDAAFSAMLSNVAIPDDLRDTIMEALGGVVDDQPAEFDADFIGGLAAVTPPEGLWDQILGAMEVEQKVVEMPSKHKRGFFKTMVWTTSAAAVVAVMVAVATFFVGAGGNALAGTTPKELEHSAIEMLESPFFQLDLRNGRQAALYEWLQTNNLPSPEQLPEGLEGLEGVGCKFLEVGEKRSRASLICFQKNDKRVHLVMMERDALDSNGLNEIQGAANVCRDCPENTEWAMTNWADSHYTYLLLGKMESSELAKIF